MHPLTRALSAVVLIVVGVVLGIQIGLHLQRAVAAGVTCTAPTTVHKPTHATASAKMLAVYKGDNHTHPDEYGSYSTTKHFVYRGSITLTFTGIQIDPTKNASGSAYLQSDVTSTISGMQQIAIAPGDTRTQTVSMTVDGSENQCKFGCWIGIVGPTNLRWHIVATK